MPKKPNDNTASEMPFQERRKQARSEPGKWQTAITRIQPNQILIRGYPVDELMGRLSFAEAIYLLLRGELPSPSIGMMFGAVLVSSLDHGVTPPATLAARNVATTGASIPACAAAGILGFGRYHGGGDIESCMRSFESGLVKVREGQSFDKVAKDFVRSALEAGTPPIGFGHRVHSCDPRATRLLQLARELELDGEYVRLVRAIERALEARPENREHPLRLNINGAIAAVTAELGFEPELANAIFTIARTPGLIAHAYEERRRQQPMRQIDPKDSAYDGPPERRLPETRK
jgi:citrate synthase